MFVGEYDLLLGSLLLLRGRRLFGRPNLKVFCLLSNANGWTVFGAHALASMTSHWRGNFRTEKGTFWMRHNSGFSRLMIDDDVFILAAKLVEIE